MSIKLSYGRVEDVLVRVNRITDEKREAFHARIKHLQKQKFPQGSNTGRGIAAQYDCTQLLQLVVAVKLMQAEISPARAAHIVKSNWSALAFSVYSASLPAGSKLNGKALRRWFWAVRLEALAVLSDSQPSFSDMVWTFPAEQLADNFTGGPRPLDLGRRILLFDGTAIVSEALKLLVDEFSLASWEEVKADLEAADAARDPTSRESKP